MVGSLIGATFGLVYVLINAGELRPAVGVPLRVLGVLAFIGVLIALLRRRSSTAGRAPDGRSFGLRYAVLVLAEVVAIAAGLRVLDRVFEAPHAGVAWVSVVVGLHFIPMAALFEVPLFRSLGAAVALYGVAGLLLAADGADAATIATVSGVLPGALLLGASWWGAVRDLRVPAAPSDTTVPSDNR